MAHFLKCTDKDGKEVFINFDHVYQMKRLRLPERKGGKEITERLSSWTKRQSRH
jgi:hypothetical protein